ncbi:hypothetical protein KC351_g13972 [Hortaea werneckii]|nr:hypothetical protein KC351_g13972 [Hortaea werneckii]
MVSRLASVPQGRDTPPDRSVHGTDHSKYAYQPLDKESLQIRLLTVYPATDPSEVPVKCSLSHANLGQEPKPEYETISYTWGQSKECKIVMLDDCPLNVPVSAERAIRRMRLRDQSRVLWIDAICINQGDINEKSHQVEIMAEIYSRTSQGLIWLGETDESTEKALQSINAAYAEAYAETNEFRDLRAKVPGIFRLAEPLGFAPDFAALACLFGRPWFCRRWVIQEAFLAPSSWFIVGDIEMDWWSVLRSIVWTTCKSVSLPRAAAFIQAVDRLVMMWILVEETQVGRHISLNLIMTSSRGSKVEDKRDTVYAILGLWLKLQRHGTKIHPLLASDYSKAPDAVICDATRYMAAVDGNLFHLHYLNHRLQSDPMAKASELNSPRQLGEVLIAGSHDGKPAIEDFPVRGLAEWLKYLRYGDSWPALQRSFNESNTATLKKVVAEYDREFWSACKNRVLFITESGRLGVGPQTLEENDLVTILYGYDLPAILRRCPDRDLHDFIGVAYVNGIMFGEAVGDAEARGIQDVTFHLQ